MKLHSPAFSRTLRARLRAEFRASPELRRDARRHRRQRVTSDLVKNLVFRLALPVIPASVLLHVQSAGCPAAARSATVSVWFLFVALLGANQVRVRAFDLPPALLNLPVAPEDFARLSRRRVLGLVWRPCFQALVLFAVLVGFGARTPLAWLAVVPLSALCGAAVWSASVWLARFPLPQAMAGVVHLLPFVLMMCIWARGLREWLFGFLVQSAGPLTLLSPGGWLAAAGLGGMGVMSPFWLLGLAPALLLAVSGYRALRELGGQVETETALLDMGNADPQQDSSCGEEEPAITHAPPAGRLSDLAAEDWRGPVVDVASQGWIERRFWGWLDQRERLVLACIATRVPPWTRLTCRGMLGLAAGVAAAWLRGRAPASCALGLAWVEGIALGVGLLTVLPLASGFDQMASAVNLYGQQVARVALYPLRLREFVRLTVKAALVRGLFVFPVTVAAACALAGPWGLSIGSLAASGAKLVFLSVALSPCLCIFALSGVSNDTRTRPGQGGCLVILLLIGGLLALLALAAATLFTPWAWSVAAALIFAALAWGMAGLYLRLYERGGFDLVSVVRE